MERTKVYVKHLILMYLSIVSKTSCILSDKSFVRSAAQALQNTRNNCHATLIGSGTRRASNIWNRLNPKPLTSRSRVSLEGELGPGSRAQDIRPWP
jgi:hypothetical protein